MEINVDGRTQKIIRLVFENLTSNELTNLLELESKLVIKGGSREGSGCYLPTRTRDIEIWVNRE